MCSPKPLQTVRPTVRCLCTAVRWPRLQTACSTHCLYSTHTGCIQLPLVRSGSLVTLGLAKNKISDKGGAMLFHAIGAKEARQTIAKRSALHSRATSLNL